MIPSKLMKEINRLGITLQKGSDIDPPLLYKTGWPSLDYAIGGIAAGRISYIWGERGVGKTTLCLNVANSFVEAGKYVLYIDAEKSWSAEWASNFVDTEQIVVMSPNKGGSEGIITSVVSLLKSENPPGLIVLDSITSMASDRELKRDMEKSLMGLSALFNNRLLRTWNITNKDTAIVIVGQFREGIGTWDYLPGGNAIAHLASLIIKMRGSPLRAKDSDLSDGDKQQVGVLSRWKIQKNKLGKPYQEGYEVIHRDGVIDTFDSELRIALGLGIVTIAGSWYSLPDGSKVQGSTKVRLWAEYNEKDWTEGIYGAMGKS